MQYEVIAYTDDEFQPETFVVDADSPDEAEQRVASSDAVHEVLEGETKPHVHRFEVCVTGGTNAVSEYLNELYRSADYAKSNVEIEAIGDRFWPRDVDLDDTDARTVAIGDWSEFIMRVTGLRDALADGGDGVDVPAGQFASDDGTVEIIAGGDVLVKAVLGDEQQFGP